MADLQLFNYGLYNNEYITAAEIAARSYNAGDPPSVRTINAFNSIIWKPVKMLVGNVLTDYAVGLDGGSQIIWRDPQGVVTSALPAVSTPGAELFALSSGLGACLWVPSSGVTFLSFAPSVLIPATAGLGKYLETMALEHNYWTSNWGTNY
jgi:hypothetical protein